MREVSMNAGDVRSIERLHNLRRLRGGVSRLQNFYPTLQRLADGLYCGRLAGFGGKDCRQSAALLQRPDFIQGEGLRAPRKAAQDDHDLAIAHAALLRCMSAFIRCRIYARPSRSIWACGVGPEFIVSSTFEIKSSGVRSSGSIN